MTEKNLNLQQFVTEVRNKIKDEQTLAYFNENISYYDMSLGGCSCSRKTRENYAEDKFIQKINTLPQEILINLKNNLGFSSEDVINFIKKDGSLIRKI